MHVRTRYGLAMVATLAIGILSRVVSTGSPLTDKYLGDALYAIAIYLVLAIFRPQRAPRWRAMLTTVAVLAIECFQLTGWPADWREEASFFWRGLSVVLGTTFGWWDVLAYLVGIAAVWSLDETTIGGERELSG